jgi:hypothetical protein
VDATSFQPASASVGVDRIRTRESRICAGFPIAEAYHGGDDGPAVADRNCARTAFDASSPGASYFSKKL